MSESVHAGDDPVEEIAIVGMAGQFPGAADVDQFWRNLSEGVESVREFSPQELALLGVPDKLVAHPDFVPFGAVLDDPAAFDRSFWGYSAREAALLDPQQRLFLQTAWHALEHAGHDPLRYPGAIGVLAGMGLSTYLLFNVFGSSDVDDGDTPLVMLGNDKDFLATRTAYHLDLRGPALSVQTGCSSSLVATHLACDSLLSYQCDMAVVGGSTVSVPQRTGYLYVGGGTASPDGHTRAFDAAAGGTVFGSGVGAVVLKRLSDARADGDTVYALVRGSAINNDGARKIGFTAPRIDGQADVVLRAQQVAGVDPRTVSYVETHGTATSMGDPMEITALTKAFRHGTADRAFCAVGSVKTNVGHLDTAAGVAGLIKTVQALRHRQLPPSLNFSRPNPLIDFAETPFFVADQLIEWPAGDTPRRAGVSAFGFGGTNAHVVLEEAPVDEQPLADPRPQVLVLSAKTPEALDTMSDRLADVLARVDDVLDLGDVAYTLQQGRAVLPHRRVVVARDHVDAVTALRSTGGRSFGGVRRDQGRPVAFLLPGLGDQYPAMGHDLFEREPVYREALQHCADVLHRRLDIDLLASLHPGEPGGAADFLDPDASPAVGGIDLRTMLGRGVPAAQIEPRAFVHPAIFAVEWALAQQWRAWGVRPSALLGHSTGEWVAATLAGVFDVDDAITLIAKRSRLIERLPTGAMLAVPLDAEQTMAELGSGLSVALVNSSELTVVSGAEPDVEELAARLARRGLATRRIASTHAYHTPALRPMLADFVAEVAAVRRSAPEIPFLSNVTGTWITASEATDPDYWGRHTESTVQFAAGLKELCRDREHVLLEVGPGQSLSSLAAAHLAAVTDSSRAVPNDGRVLASMRASYDTRRTDPEVLRDVLARLWVAGVDIDWDGVHAPRRPHRRALPGYPFARERAWIDPPVPGAKITGATGGRRGDYESWLLAPGWRSLAAPPPRTAADRPQRCVLFCDGSSTSRALADRLRAEGTDVVVVAAAGAGAGLEVVGQGYRFDPGHSRSYNELFDRLQRTDGVPDLVVHLWSRRPGATALDAQLRDGFYSVAYLGRALAGRAAQTRLTVLTDGLAAVDDCDRIDPGRALVVAPAKCIPQEYEGVDVHVLDIGLRDGMPDPAHAATLVDTVLDTIAERPRARLLAVRGRRRWVRDHATAGLTRPLRPLTEASVVVVIGGLGRIGLRLAEHLATTGARLVLVGRTADPGLGRDATNGGPTAARIAAMRRAGADVRVHRADAGNAAELERVLSSTVDEFGAVDVIVHAAGIGGEAAFGMLDDLGPELSEPQFDAKVRSAATLADVLADGPWEPDSVVLLSSNAALLGGLGGATYTAGNVYLDALAESVTSPTRWVSVNLEEWLPDDGGTSIGYQTSFSQYAISAFDGVRILQRVIECATDSRVAVVTADLDERVRRWLEEPSAERRPDRATGVRSERPALTAPFVAPRAGTESVIAGVWAEVLGFVAIGRDDNFYELGGHSLLATQIVTRLNRVLPVRLSLLDMFRSPSIAGLGAEVERSLACAAEQAAGEVPPDTPVRRVERTGKLPASFAQQRFWFLDQLAPGNPFYTILDAARISGPLVVADLHTALRQLVARHEALRTTLHQVDGEPVQVILPADQADVPLTVVELEGTTDPLLVAVDGSRMSEALTALAEEQLGIPFDLSTGPLLRACVARLGPGEHVLLLTTHHSVSDAWSTGVVVRELAAVYPAVRAGRPALLEPLAFHYADFAQWQRDHVAGDRLALLLDHWMDVLDGAPALLELPTDRSRPVTQTFAGAAHRVSLPANLMDRVRRCAAAQDATLFMALLAAFTTVLHLRSAQDDIVVGTPIAGRVLPEFEDIVGAFVNMLPLRTRIRTDEPFTQLLDRVRTSTLNAYDHQVLPFELLVEALAPARDLSHSPVFQVALVLQNVPLPELRVGDLHLTPLTPPAVTARFDLMLMLREVDEGAVGTIEYSTDLFDAATIEGLARAFVSVLEQVTEDPARAVGSLELVCAADRAELLDDVRPLDGPEPVSAIEELARREPHAPAVRDAEGATTSFAELVRRADAVASWLRAAGTRPGDRIGLHLDRDVDTIAILLGILRAGAAYVPLDPAYPADRLAHMTTDSGVRVVVSDGAELPYAAAGVRVVTREDVLDAHPDGRPAFVAEDADVAFVIYTSGSTGGPKGVLGTHGGMRNRLRWMWAEYPFAADEVCCQKTSLNFLDSFWEIFGPLAQGVPIVVTPHAVVTDIPRLVGVLAEAGVTRLVVVPSLLAALLDIVPDLSRRLPRLWLWVTSGEPLPPGLVVRFHHAFVTSTDDARGGAGRSSAPTLLNLYGASEVSADVTAHVVGPADGELTAVPIGRPIAGVRVLLLDGRMRLTPAGAEGDVYVGGVALARGYLGRPGMTAETFVPDPFASVPGARLYRTGDRARRRADGVLEYRGRHDGQVKVRGHRVELAEVEHALQRHPAVAAAVAVVRDGSSGAAGTYDALDAYVVFEASAPAPSRAQLREHLLHVLPAYAVPNAFVVLDELPLTPSGKLDRRTLPVPTATSGAAEGVAPVPPRDAVEEVVAGLWCNVLSGDLGQVDVQTNFFTAGGHSLLATRLVARVNESFGSEVALSALFQDPTIAGIALALRESGPGAAEVERRAQLLLTISGLSDDQVEAMIAGGGGR